MKSYRIIHILLMLFVAFLSGCATYSKTDNGTTFYKEGSWEEANQNIDSWLSARLYRASKQDIIKKFGKPIREINSSMSLAFAWMEGQDKNRDIDVGIYKNIDASSERHILITIFNKNDILVYYEVQSFNIPEHTSLWSTKILMQGAFYIYSYMKLDDLISGALERSLEKFRQDLNETGVELQNKFNESGIELPAN